jgi:hypothetical protein
MMPWCGAKTLFRIEAIGEPKWRDEFFDDDAVGIEERVVLLEARDLDEAVKKALEEADQYASYSFVNIYGQPVRLMSIGGCDCTEITEELSSGVEIYSATELARQSVTKEEIVNARFGAEPDDKDRGRRRKFQNAELARLARDMRRRQ